MSEIATCGHALRGNDIGWNICVAGFDGGDRCIVNMVVCRKCLDGYIDSGKILMNYIADDEWLSNGNIVNSLDPKLYYEIIDIINDHRRLEQPTRDGGQYSPFVHYNMFGEIADEIISLIKNRWTK